MECKQERSNCKQLIGNHKLKYQTDIKKNLHNNSPHNRSQHNIKRKMVNGRKCKKCQEKAKSKDNNEDLFIEQETTKHTQETHNKKEIKICNTIKPSNSPKFNEKINKDRSEMEMRKKKKGNKTVFVKTNDVNTNKHISTNNRNKFHKHLKVTFSEQSDSSFSKQNIKSCMENPHTRQKTLYTVSNNCKRMNLDSEVFIKAGEIQKFKNVNKQNEPAQVQAQNSIFSTSTKENSTFSTSTKDSIKGLHSYREEMNITKNNNQLIYPLINVTSTAENVSNIIDIYKLKGKLKIEKAGPIGDAEKFQCQSQQVKEDITKHKNVKQKEYFPPEAGKQISNLISKVVIRNGTQGVNVFNKDKKKKSRFSNSFKDTRREEIKKKSLKNSGIKSPGDATPSCDIYENSIGDLTPKSQKSLSDSYLKLKTKMYRYKSRKNKILSTKHSSKSLSNSKGSKSLQNIKQNNLCNTSSELNQRNKSKPHELTNFSASDNNVIAAEKIGNDGELQKSNINNSYPKYDSNDLSISASVDKFNQEEKAGNEDQWCFADPRLYSCDSELVLDDGQRTINSSGPSHKFISPENSNESCIMNDGKICKSNTSFFEINSVISLEELNEKFSEINNTLQYSNEHSMNEKEIEPVIHINTIQNEYNKVKPKPYENYYKNEVFNNDEIIHTCNENKENDTSKRLMQTLPHQSAVTIISGFGSKSSLDNRKKSEDDLNQFNSSLKNIDISFTFKKDIGVSASTSYEILGKTKQLTDKGIMCYEAIPSKVKKHRLEKLKITQQKNQRETKQIGDTLLGKQNGTHHFGSMTAPNILNQRDKVRIEKHFSQQSRSKGIYSEKRKPGRSTKHHNSSNKEILQNKEENKSEPYIRQEELEDVKMKFKDSFTVLYNKEKVKSRQSKGFWNTLRTGGRRLIRFLQDSASFKYCFKKNMFN